ncbi:MAG: hypothetical protein K6E43_05075 [Lachnospiraceae bacterium]|nr:hypothetical protein [Lachnospiraceae bacterium]
MSKINIYFDMDGVQTIYYKDEIVEDMMKPGYFLSRTPHFEMLDLIKLLLADDDFHVTILSAVFTDDHSAYEKAVWLDKHGLGMADVTFMPCGRCKSDYVSKDGLNILVDDFSKNLFDWENAGDNFIGVKYLNEINGTQGNWVKHSGRVIDYKMSAEEMYASIILYAMSYLNTIRRCG